MKWPWTPEPDVSEAERAVEEARRKLAEAERQLNDAKRQWPEVRRVSDHFAQSVETIFKGNT